MGKEFLCLNYLPGWTDWLGLFFSLAALILGWVLQDHQSTKRLHMIQTAFVNSFLAFSRAFGFRRLSLETPDRPDVPWYLKAWQIFVFQDSKDGWEIYLAKRTLHEKKNWLFNIFELIGQVTYTRNHESLNSPKKACSNEGKPGLKSSANLGGGGRRERGQERTKKSLIMTELEKQECE